MLIFLSFFACLEKDPADTIKHNAKSHLWVAQNTVLLYSECHKKYKIDRENEPEKWKLIIKQQGIVCKKYNKKSAELINWCNTVIPEELSHPKAPYKDPEFIEIKEKLEKICTIILSAPENQPEEKEEGSDTAIEGAKETKDEAKEKQEEPKNEQ